MEARSIKSWCDAENAGEHRPKILARKSGKKSSTTVWCSPPCKSTDPPRWKPACATTQNYYFLQNFAAPPRSSSTVYRDPSPAKTEQPLHLGPNRSRHGAPKVLVWSAARLFRRAACFYDGYPATLFVFRLRHAPAAIAAKKFTAACELLQSLGPALFFAQRHRVPRLCRPHHTSSTFQELAERTQDYIREMMPTWEGKTQYERPSRP